MASGCEGIRDEGLKIGGRGAEHLRMYFSKVCYPLRFARQSKQDAHIWIPRLGKFPNAPLFMPTQWVFSASPPDVPATTYVERTYVRTYVRRWRRWRNALGLPEPSLNVSPIPGPKPRPGAPCEPKPGPKPKPKPGLPLQRGPPTAKRPGQTKCAPRFFSIFSICSRKRRPQGG